eukprot:jgi/Ulvmu1/6518/UM003_0151.1
MRAREHHQRVAACPMQLSAYCDQHTMPRQPCACNPLVEPEVIALFVRFFSRAGHQMMAFALQVQSLWLCGSIDVALKHSIQWTRYCDVIAIGMQHAAARQATMPMHSVKV